MLSFSLSIVLIRKLGNRDDMFLLHSFLQFLVFAFIFSHNVEILYRELVASHCDGNTYAWNLHISLE